MGKIGYGYGSEWHLLRYLGYHRDYLQNSILQITGGSHIQWLDFPFSTVNQALHHDQEWQGIEFIDDANVQKKWDAFWPQTGNPPNWDAVGKLLGSNGEEWLLIEAKAHLEEVHSSCAATHPKSVEMINNALFASQASFASKVTTSQWLSPYYQFCNRLSVLHFLMRACEPAIPAHLVFVYFLGDTNGNQKCPQSVSEWKVVIQKMYETIGLDIHADLFSRVHQIFLPVNPRINL